MTVSEYMPNWLNMTDQLPISSILDATRNVTPTGANLLEIRKSLVQIGQQSARFGDDDIPDDCRRDLHDGLAQGDEKVEQRSSPGAHFAESDAEDGRENDQAQDVGGVVVSRRHAPLVQIDLYVIRDANP